MDSGLPPPTPDPRFAGLARLYGAARLERLRAAHVVVIGIGGVGSWAVEALARSGVGAMTLVDLDDVCLTNLNRQLAALDGTVGRLKVDVMADRVRAIAPDCAVSADPRFFTERTADAILSGGCEFVVDAIDAVDNKCRLLAACRRRGLPVATSAGAGGRQDPTKIAEADLARTTNDPLAAQVRKKLRREHGFPSDPGERFGIPCVYSTEPLTYPAPDGTTCDRPAEGGARINCDAGLGTAAFVTGAFGLHLAGIAVRTLAQKRAESGVSHTTLPNRSVD
ncbi:MAG: ThiF family adenylyltransferase [Opitutales bacterium]